MVRLDDCAGRKRRVEVGRAPVDALDVPAVHDGDCEQDAHVCGGCSWREGLWPGGLLATPGHEARLEFTLLGLGPLKVEVMIWPRALEMGSHAKVPRLHSVSHSAARASRQSAASPPLSASLAEAGSGREKTSEVAPKKVTGLTLSE